MNKQTIKKYAPLLLVLAALILRMVYLNDIADKNPYFQDETLVAEVNHQWAKDIASGRQTVESEPFIRAPLYPYFLSVIYKIFGTSTFTPRLIQLLISAGLAFLIYKAGDRIFGFTGGIAAGIIWAFYGPEMFFAGELFETSLATALIFIIYLVLEKAINRNSANLFALSGILLGLTVLMKPNSALFLPILFIYILLLKNEGKFNWKQSSVFALVCIITILPVTIRNYIVGKEFVPVSAYGGLNYYIGNNPQSDGVSAIFPEWIEELQDDAWGRNHHATALTALSIRKASEKVSEELTPAESSSFWWRESVKWMMDEPGKFILLNLKKIAVFFSGFEFGNTRDVYFARYYSNLLSVLLWNFNGIKFPFGLLIPFAGLGIFYLLKNKLPGRKTILVFLISAVLSTTLIFVCARFRMPAIPFLVILAGGGLITAFRDLNAKKFVTNLIIFVPLVVIANGNFFKLEKDTSYQEFYNLGRHYLKQQKFNEALYAFNSSFQAKPNHLPTLNELGLLYEAMGNYEEAVRYQSAVVQALPDNPLALYNLGAAEGKAGLFDDAIKHLSKAVELDETFWQARLNLGNAYAAIGQYNDAEECFNKTLELVPDSPDLIFNMGTLQILKGDTLEARKYFRQVKEINPEYPNVNEMLKRIEDRYGK